MTCRREKCGDRIVMRIPDQKNPLGRRREFLQRLTQQFQQQFLLGRRFAAQSNDIEVAGQQSVKQRINKDRIDVTGRQMKYQPASDANRVFRKNEFLPHFFQARAPEPESQCRQIRKTDALRIGKQPL